MDELLQKELSPERALELMLERTAKLSRRQEEKAIEDMEVLTFKLERETYAIESKYIRKIVPFTGFTRVPGAPDFLVGVINLHGHIVAIIDLKPIYGLGSEMQDENSKMIIVIGFERTEFAILADSVETFVKLNRTDLTEPPDIVNGAGKEHFLGIRLDALIVLDGDALIADRRLYINETV